MENVRTEQSWMLHFVGSVKYDGRAKSTLENCPLVAIHKRDGTLLIHGGTLCTPRNYQPPGAVMIKDKTRLISTRNDEKIVITVEKIINYYEIDDWSNNKIKISRTEKDLRDHLVKNIEKIIGIKPVETYIEFQTPVGFIDILAIDEYDRYHVIEVKRGKASLASCSQLERYSNYFIDIMKNVCDYIASPDATANAKKYMDEQHQKWLKVEHKE